MTAALTFTLDATPACATADPELFFRTDQALAVAQAKAICMDCPLRYPCLKYAIAHRVDGVWGGTTGEQRAAIGARPKAPRELGLKPCGTNAAARRHERKREPLCEPCRQAREVTARERRLTRQAFLTGTDDRSSW
jgi:WhiB family redox-sensing transcriptional regulator